MFAGSIRSPSFARFAQFAGFPSCSQISNGGYSRYFHKNTALENLTAARASIRPKLTAGGAVLPK
jgi:hypothetical protein